MDARRVKQKVSAGFKMRGLILRPYVTLSLSLSTVDVFILTGFLTRVKLCSRESSRFLLQVLESVTEADLEEVLERILDAVEKQPRESHHV